MVTITSEQMNRIQNLLKGVKNGAGKVYFNAINRGLITAKSESKKAVKENYNIKSRDFDKNIKLTTKTANPQNLEGSILFKGNLIPLINFDTVPTKPKFKKVEVAVKKGARTPIGGAFVTDLGRFGVGVFKKESGRSKQLFGPSISHMVQNDVVIEDVEEKMQETIDKRIDHEIERLLNNY